MKLCLACGTGFSAVDWICPARSWSPVEDGTLRFAPELADSSGHFPRDVSSRLAAVEESHFWFAARNELILWLIQTYFPRARTLLEVGYGTGAVLTRIHAAYPTMARTGADLSPEALEVARNRVPGAIFEQIDIRRIPYDDGFDIVCALDVLEHIDEDGPALAEIFRAVRNGGGVVISVPQHAWLWSALDEYGRHRRRYTRAGLLGLVNAAGFATERVTSAVSLLLPAVAISRILHRHVTDNYDPFRELSIPSVLNRVFGVVMRAERELIRRGVSLPLGSSLIVVAHKR